MNECKSYLHAKKILKLMQLDSRNRSSFVNHIIYPEHKPKTIKSEYMLANCKDDSHRPWKNRAVGVIKLLKHHLQKPKLFHDSRHL